MEQPNRDFPEIDINDSAKLKHQLDLISHVCSKLGNGEKFSDQLRFLTAKICELFGTNACVIRKRNQNMLDLLYAHGIGEGFLSQSLPVNVGIANELVLQRRPVTILNAKEDPVTSQLHNQTKADSTHFKFCSFAGVPMLAHEEVVGVIGTYTTQEQKAFTASDLNMLQIIANSAGLAMRNDQLVGRISGADAELQVKIVELLADSEKKARRESSEKIPLNSAQLKNYHLEYDIRQDHLDLVVYYQPLHCPGQNHTVGYEALVRWNHPRLGMLQPNAFIPVAESCGLISKIGSQVYRLVASEFRSLIQTDPNASFVSINVSILELSNEGYAESLQSIFQEFGISPSQVVLELTERSPLEQRSQAARNLFLLSQMGFRIYLDDFGTGHTSLSYLLNYSFHGIKIDKIFMPESRNDVRRVQLIKNLISLAHDLDLTVVAEGIETLEQEELCGELGFDLLQGFSIGRPAPTAV